MLNAPIPCQHNYNYLRITLDKHLHFRDHIRRVRQLAKFYMSRLDEVPTRVETSRDFLCRGDPSGPPVQASRATGRQCQSVASDKADDSPWADSGSQHQVFGDFLVRESRTHPKHAGAWQLIRFSSSSPRKEKTKKKCIRRSCTIAAICEARAEYTN
ncbi:hypothetical protein EVAR_75696_1 [Eumeta japonica]|uniref:Uncharacterized protein n=1 Tax=Eumeta variegata TaxID=151549 RepID=A0A4C1W0L0_EUMVA|nr:hypothetical protein EVAR_75696_1 [Eumeta japonica]